MKLAYHIIVVIMTALYAIVAKGEEATCDKWRLSRGSQGGNKKAPAALKRGFFDSKPKGGRRNKPPVLEPFRREDLGSISRTSPVATHDPLLDLTHSLAACGEEQGGTSASAMLNVVSHDTQAATKVTTQQTKSRKSGETLWQIAVSHSISVLKQGCMRRALPSN